MSKRRPTQRDYKFTTIGSLRYRPKPVERMGTTK
jgi:hypothetical protein